jgi:hypothetical protein
MKVAKPYKPLHIVAISMQVIFEYVIEKVTRLENGEVEILATGVSPENIATAINPDVEVVMQSIPSQMREMMNQQQKMFQDMQKPMLKFRITEQQYTRGDWKVGGIVEVSVTEQESEKL